MWNLKEKQKQVHRYREQIGGCQRWTFGRGGEMGKGDQKVQTSSYKISHEDAMYSMVTIVNNTVLHI